MSPSEPDERPGRATGDRPQFRPVERFWPYATLDEHLSEAELLALEPELYEALFGPRDRPFSISLQFPRFDGPDYERALAMARASAEYLEVGRGSGFRSRARFYPEDARALRDLYEVVGRLDETEVLVDDKPVPHARELWLPLVWCLLAR